jgi:pyruvate dehydrogenase E1 component alpha subunit
MGDMGFFGVGFIIALGAAQAVKLKREDRIVVAFFGDGAMNRGPMLEALNWARVFDLRVLFVCEDNLYSDRTRTGSVTGGPGVLARAGAFGIPAESVDGNDVLAVYEAAARLVARVRAGKGPHFLHATTYRWKGHLALDKGLYRDTAETDRWKTNDPLIRAERWLVSRGVAEPDLESARKEAAQRVREAAVAAEAAPWPDVRALTSDVQDVGAP